jgi:sugar phosphate isomerase/epimerase
MVPIVKSGATTGTLEEAKMLTDQFNKMAIDINKAGMRAGSHNEAFDLVKLPDGTFIYDHIIAMTDPKLIGFQFQMSTITTGLIAAEYFAKYPTRFFSMHIQDIDMKTEVPGRAGRGPGHPQKPVGQGSIDWAATFAAAKKAGGIKNYFVEQAMDMTKESVAALKAMKA